MTADTGLSVLVADDNDIDRMILETIVRKEGHTVYPARNGFDAIAVYQEHRPDIVLMDALMPELDGFEAARRIRELAGETLVPIIFLTSLTDTPSLVRCLDAGGDDFLSKPYNRVILQAKIKSFNRMREMHATMLEQRNQITRHHDFILQEQIVARQVFDNIAHSGCLDASNVRYYLSSLAVFNGDVLVAARSPSGNMMILLGDFTGHGLPAAIGAMPLATTFYGMVHKGFSLSDILREINGKLKSTLPVGIFCCAVMVEVNFHKQRIAVWNGGLPDAVVYRHHTGEHVCIPSTHVPLGVLSEQRFQVNCQYVDMAYGDRFFMWSDGIHEARNEQGEMFGEARLLQLFDEKPAAEVLFDELISRVNQFVGESDRNDDLSIFEITMERPAPEPLLSKIEKGAGQKGLQDWGLCFEVRPDSFRAFDPLPLLLRILMQVPGISRSLGSLYTILAELYSNALEHGILKLDSALKQGDEGFRRYYQLRDERLRDVTEGFVRFHLDHQSGHEGGSLSISVTDSGIGFDTSLIRYSEESHLLSGRGLALLHRLCDEVTFSEAGNEVKVVYSWRNQEPV